jgi:hypothetical protein
MAEEVVQGVVDGERLLPGAGQPIEIRQDLRVEGAQVIVDLASAAQFEDEEEEADPQEEALVVRDGLLEPAVREVVEPGGKSPARNAGGCAGRSRRGRRSSRPAAFGLDVTGHPGDGQGGDLPDQQFEAFGLGDPLAHLPHEVLRDIDGPGLAGLLEGQVVPDVLGAGLTVAAGPAAVLGDLDEAGLEDGPAGGQAPDAGVQHPADEGGVSGNAHGGLLPRVETRRPRFYRIRYNTYPILSRKMQVRKKKKMVG